MVEKFWRYDYSFRYNSRTWQTDGHRATAKPPLCFASRGKNPEHKLAWQVAFIVSLLYSTCRIFSRSGVVVFTLTDVLPGYVEGQQYDAHEFLVHLLDGVGTSVGYVHFMLVMLSLFCWWMLIVTISLLTTIFPAAVCGNVMLTVYCSADDCIRCASRQTGIKYSSANCLIVNDSSNCTNSNSLTNTHQCLLCQCYTISTQTAGVWFVLLWTPVVWQV